MKENGKNGELLQSWKEIASYLGCDPRTCRRWEKQLNLPVRRIGEGERPRIIAFKKDLNEWLISTGQKRTEISRKPFFKIAVVLFILMAAAVLAVSLSTGWMTKIFMPKNPEGFLIENSELIILNSKGDPLWRFDTGIENLCAQSVYERHFQYKRIAEEDAERKLPFLIIKDLDADQKPEVLFSTQTQDEFGEGMLVCFDAAGREMWRFDAGREMKFGSTVYSHDYRIKGFDVLDFDGDGTSEILVIARHRNHYPNQTTLLDSKGSTIGEYWHSGYLIDYCFTDIDGDRREEILLGGCNNEYKKGCILALKPDNIYGGSPQTGEYRCEGLETGAELYYVLLPRTAVDKKDDVIGSINSIDILKNENLLVCMRISHLYFEFNDNFSLNSINISHLFKLKYDSIFDGKITMTELQNKMRSELSDKVLYYDGQEWVDKPTPASMVPQSD